MGSSPTSSTRANDKPASDKASVLSYTTFLRKGALVSRLEEIKVSNAQTSTPAAVRNGYLATDEPVLSPANVRRSSANLYNDMRGRNSTQGYEIYQTLHVSTPLSAALSTIDILATCRLKLSIRGLRSYKRRLGPGRLHSREESRP